MAKFQCVERKPQGVVTTILKVDSGHNLKTGSALKVPLAETDGIKREVRSALNRATRKEIAQSGHSQRPRAFLLICERRRRAAD